MAGNNDGSPGSSGVAPAGVNDGAPGGGFAPAYDDNIINALPGDRTDGDGVQDTVTLDSDGTNDAGLTPVNGGAPGGTGVAPLGNNSGSPGSGIAPADNQEHGLG